MPDLLPWPFSLPGRLLDQLGYAGAIEAFESPASARPVHLEAAELRYLAARPLPTTDEDLAHVRRAPLPQRSPSGWRPASACQAAVSFG